LTADDTLQAVVNSAGDATAGDVDLLNSAETTLGMFSIRPVGGPEVALRVTPGALPSASWSASTGCVLNAGNGRFVCAPQTNNGLTLTRSYAFYDAGGNLMTKFNDSTTVSIDVQSTVTGVRPSATGADTINRQSDLTVSGLAGHNTTRTWNGSGTRTDGGYGQDSVALRTYHQTDNTTFSSILVNLPRTSNPWPASGNITRLVSGTGTVTRNGQTKPLTYSRTVSITFNGTEFVPMTVGSANYTLDLATGKAAKQ
jgi:hypothetical protein